MSREQKASTGQLEYITSTWLLIWFAVFNPYKNYRTLRRYQQIILTVGRYGFGELIGRLHLFTLLKLKKKPTSPEQAAASPGIRFRLMLEQLGPTFIKLGQMLTH